MKKTLIFLQAAIISCTTLADYEDYYAQDVSGKDFSSKSLANSIWDYATAVGTKFSSSDLTNASFDSANLTKADFKYANLANAIFLDANISGADFSIGTKGFTKEQLYSTANYKSKDLSGIRFSFSLKNGDGQNLSSWDFSSQNLANAWLFDANLTSANFASANLRGARFGYSKLADANFENAIINDAEFYYSTITINQLRSTKSYKNKDLSGIDFSHTNLYGGISFVGFDLRNANFSNTYNSRYANLGAPDFTDAIINGAKFGESSFFYSKDLYVTASYKKRDLTYVSFSDGYVGGYNFFMQNLQNASFNSAYAGDANFAFANLTNTDFRGATINDANFLDTTSRGFTEKQLASTGSYDRKNLSGVNFSYNNLSGWNFDQQKLENAEFVSADLSVASLNGANLTSANLSCANLESASADGANFTSATLENTNFTGAHIQSANFSDTVSRCFTKEQLYSTFDYKNKNLYGVNLSNNDLSGWVFDGLNLTNVNFSGSDLSDAKISGAVLSGTVSKGFTKEQLYSTANYKNKDLRKIDFSSCAVDGNIIINDLSDWSFAEQNLTDANFNEANLTNTDLKNANLTNARFKESTLTGANFEGAIINGAHFIDVPYAMKSISKEQLYSTASYKNKDLSNVVLCVIDLAGWNFVGQNLQNADFYLGYYRAEFTNTNFRQADLRGAVYISTIDSAIFRNTIMTDGYIKNFTMTVPATSFSIRKYVPATEGGATISAKIGEDASISGGAELTLETGAELEITKNSLLTVSNNSSIFINTDADSSTSLSVASGAGLSFEDGAILKINVEGNFIASDTYTIAVISWGDDSRMTGLNDFTVDETLFLSVNGVARRGNWSYVIENNKMLINFVAVPEPATFAAIFGLLALGFAARRNLKRK